MSRTVELRDRNDILTAAGYVQDGVMQSRLPGTYAERSDPALQRSNAALQHIVRRVADPPVAVSFDFEIEQGGTVFGAVEGVGHRLIDGNRDCPGYRINLVATVDCNRFATQICPCKRPLQRFPQVHDLGSVIDSDEYPPMPALKSDKLHMKWPAFGYPGALDAMRTDSPRNTSWAASGLGRPPPMPLTRERT